MKPINQAYFVEIIRVDQLISTTCKTRIILGQSKWQNPRDRFDVNGDGVVDQEDYDVLAAYLSSHTTGPLPLVRSSGDPYVDIDGDGQLTSTDLILLGNFLTSKSRSPITEEECYDVIDFKIERDLISPALVGRVSQLAASKGLNTENYLPYRRNWHTGKLSSTDYTESVVAKDSIVFVHKDVTLVTSQFASGCGTETGTIRRLEQRLRNSRNILPSRFVWP